MQTSCTCICRASSEALSAARLASVAAASVSADMADDLDKSSAALASSLFNCASLFSSSLSSSPTLPAV